MADKDLSQNIDKLSYAVCGVVGLIVIVLASMSGGELATATSNLETSVQTVEERLEEQEVSAGGRAERIAPVLEEQWEVPDFSADPSWVTERIPILVRKSERPVVAPAVHEAGYIEQISFERDPDAKRPVLRVRGVMGASNDGVEITRVTLLRRVDDGELVPVPTFRESGDFEFVDTNVTPGSAYSYQLVTTAKPVGQRALSPGAVERTSPECGPTLPIPYDFELNIMFIQAGQNGEPPRLRGKKVLWDYEKGELVEDKSPAYYNEGAPLDESGRYEIRQIDGTGRTAVVYIRDNVARQTLQMKTREDRTVKAWEPLVCGPGESTDSGFDDSAGDDADDDTTGTDAGAADDASTTEPDAGDASGDDDDDDDDSGGSGRSNPFRRRGFR